MAVMYYSVLTAFHRELRLSIGATEENSNLRSTSLLGGRGQIRIPLIFNYINYKMVAISAIH